MRTIYLTQNQITLVDDENYEWLSQWKWCANWNKSTQSFYAVRAETDNKKHGLIMMHRQIMNTPKRMKCDHKNHNTLDNQKSNLRNSTNSQNMMNGKLRTNNTVGHKNISMKGNKYLVSIYKDYTKVFNKSFKTLDEAIRARDEALENIHGEYSSH